MQNIEIVLTNRCNNACVFCHSPLEADENEMNFETCKKVLQWGRKAGATGAYFGGGEPTFMENFVELAAVANAAGYKRIRVLTNGMRLSDPAYADALIQSGVNEFEISIKGHDAETHDALSQFPGAFSNLVRAVKNLARHGADVIISVLITTHNVSFLPETVSMFADRGVRRFNLKVVSLYDMDREKLSYLLPSFSQIALHVAGAFSVAEQRNLSMDTSQIPPCFLPERQRKNFLSARDLDLLVIMKNRKFSLEDSAFEGSVKSSECLKCVENERCPGLRADYVEIFGTGELKAVGTSEWKQSSETKMQKPMAL